jgi:4-amino-4-deoxy-L-arabinose transferase-like glycosyltransferase
VLSSTHRRSLASLLDSLYAGALILYVLAGISPTPFHGDEATIIYMSHDWYTLTHNRDLQPVLYTQSPATPQARDDQELRLLNGPLSSYAIGLGWSLAGLSVKDLNGPWAWGLDWWENRYYGHLPGPQMLFVARLTSALMTALSVAVVFAIGRRLGGRVPAQIGTFVYATMPSVLLNGRRAMFEGALLLTLSLVILVGIELAQRMHRRKHSSSLKHWLLLGAASGLALSSKHSAALTIVPVFGVLLVLGWRNPFRTLGYTVAALVVAGAVFLLLNPAWWSGPLEMPGHVVDLRRNMFGIQATFYDELSDAGKRGTAPMRYLFGSPQYAEDAKFDWTPWIGGQITAYESSGLAGIDWYRQGILTYALSALGLMFLVIARNPSRLVLVGTIVLSSAAIVMTNTLPWQRYYLPLAACVAILFGIGTNAAAVYLLACVRRATVRSAKVARLER